MNNIITEDAAARKMYDDLWRACAAAFAQGNAQIDPHLRGLTGDPAAAARFVPISVAADSVEAAADKVEADVRAMAPYDVMLLGMGEDGHVASLIPGSPALDLGMDPRGTRFCLGIPAGVGSPPLARVTMTMPALLQARLILVLISGAKKRDIVEKGNGLPVHALLRQAQAPVRVLWNP